MSQVWAAIIHIALVSTSRDSAMPRYTSGAGLNFRKLWTLNMRSKNRFSPVLTWECVAKREIKLAGQRGSFELRYRRFYGVPDGAPAICQENAMNEEAVKSMAGSTVE